jgi:hypothetical protein
MLVKNESSQGILIHLVHPKELKVKETMKAMKVLNDYTKISRSNTIKKDTTKLNNIAKA